MSTGLVTSETVVDATGVTGDTVSIGAEGFAVMSAGLVTSERVADASGGTVSIGGEIVTVLSAF